MSAAPPSPRRPAPSPPVSMVPLPQTGTRSSAPTSLKELIAERNREKQQTTPVPIPPPSPALSNASDQESGRGAAFQFPARLPPSPAPAHSSREDDDEKNDGDYQFPPSPQSFKESHQQQPDFSPAPSIGSVRTAKVGVRETATRTNSGGGSATGAGGAPSGKKSTIPITAGSPSSSSATSSGAGPVVGGNGPVSHSVLPAMMELKRNSCDTVDSGMTTFESTRGDDEGTQVLDGQQHPYGRSPSSRGTSPAPASRKTPSSPLPSEDAWMARSRDVGPPSPISTSGGPIRATAVPLTPTSLHPPAPKVVIGQQVGSSEFKAHRRSASADSQDSGSWRTNLDNAVNHIAAAEASVDPSLRPETDAMMRMKSILGPKMKIISPAPWDTEDDADTRSVASTSTSAPDSSAVSSSSASVRGRQSSENSRKSKESQKEKEATKENSKPKSGGRTRSFSVLGSRRSPAADANDAKASEEALRGLGLGLGLGALSSGGAGDASPTKARSLKSSSKRSPSPMPQEASIRPPDIVSSRKSSAPPDLGGGSFAFPPPARSTTPVPSQSTTTSIPPSPPSLSKAYKSTRGRAPAPVVFEMITPGTKLTPSAPPTPKSAPATTASFSITDTSMPRSGSNGSLTVRIPPLSTSGSLHSLASGISSPTSPTSAHTITSPLGGPVSGGPTGYKLISLAEARQREVDRVNQAAAQRKAMLPVEHIAGKDEVSYGATSASSPGDRTRESSSGSTIGRSSPALGSAFNSGTMSTSASSVNIASSSRSLKSKKSGFLKRMMGGEKTGPLPSLPDRSETPVPETYRALPDDYSLSVTVSCPDDTPSIVTPTVQVPSSAGGRVAFLSTPTPDPDQRIRKGLAPSLSLRPISMAFSAGLPSDFLASMEAAAAADTLTPRNTSPTLEQNLQSPFAPSFRSAQSSSIFDSDASSITSSSAATPITPQFSPLIPYFHEKERQKSPASIVYEGPESFMLLQEQFNKAKKSWKAQQWELETQIKALRAELEDVKSQPGTPITIVGETEANDCQCEQCGCAIRRASTAASVLARPRPVQSTATGGLFGSGLAL
ncbi:hypothetical protein T439DRAFT_253729 [Meredithblackwellia eburnea MCA 4105]